MVGGKDSASGWKAIGTSPSCLEASVSDHSTASGGCLLPRPGDASHRGARSHPKTDRGQDMSQETGEQKQISLQMGCMVFTSCTDPASFSQVHMGGCGRGQREGRCPGQRGFRVLGRGGCHLPAAWDQPCERNRAGECEPRHM
ncbi:hypothetical protein HJG60_010795 [Phyllostomus discolor]|uniref:Uncharacterized protein n=1 Tax=Phyllostomus discolor TaxID=89673 RepID=A0A834ECP5_9CHIR|nr:hypothetical protein HJG60_010795 [Phyllostomus discolor]